MVNFLVVVFPFLVQDVLLEQVVGVLALLRIGVFLTRKLLVQSDDMPVIHHVLEVLGFRCKFPLHRNEGIVGGVFDLVHKGDEGSNFSGKEDLLHVAEH